MFYLCSLGSNIEPTTNVPQAIHALIDSFAPICFSSFIYTTPCDIQSSNIFVNGLFYFSCTSPSTAIKDYFNQLEIRHGRDRTDIHRSIKDRVLDLDIILTHPHKNLQLTQALPAYLQELYQELTEQIVPHSPRFIFTIDNDKYALQLGDRATTIDSNLRAC